MIIALEGIDGAGKTTEGMRLVARLVDDGHKASYVKVALLSSPEYDSYDDVLRELFRLNRPLHDKCEAALILLDTFRCIRNEVLPRHASGEIVVCDRYLAGGRALFGACGYDLTEYDRLTAMLPASDMTVLLDIPFDVAASRAGSREGESSASKLSLLRLIHSSLGEEATRDEWHRVDATMSADDVESRILSLVRLAIGQASGVRPVAASGLPLGH
jgi:dTMP kinase